MDIFIPLKEFVIVSHQALMLIVIGLLEGAKIPHALYSIFILT